MPAWSTTSDACSTICGCPTSGTGTVGPVGPAGATGPSISFIAGNTGPYLPTSITSFTSATANRVYQQAFTVSSSTQQFLIHYNIILGNVTNNRRFTSTLGLSDTINQTALLSINLSTGTVPVTLAGADTDNYIAGSNGDVSANHACNLIGFATVTNISTIGTNYITIWLAPSGSDSATSATADIVILQVK